MDLSIRRKITEGARKTPQDSNISVMHDHTTELWEGHLVSPELVSVTIFMTFPLSSYDNPV